jgi:hypothetical protein
VCSDLELATSAETNSNLMRAFKVSELPLLSSFFFYFFFCVGGAEMIIEKAVYFKKVGHIYVYRC